MGNNGLLITLCRIMASQLGDNIKQSSKRSLNSDAVSDTLINFNGDIGNLIQQTN